jgi:Cof subfamily protein (haloacid dehalogenase superfamily)
MPPRAAGTGCVSDTGALPTNEAEPRGRDLTGKRLQNACNSGSLAPGMDTSQTIAVALVSSLIGESGGALLGGLVRGRHGRDEQIRWLMLAAAEELATAYRVGHALLRRVRLAAIDLDGTLVRSDGAVSERSRAAIRRASRSGIEIVLITARGPRSVGELAAELGIRGEAICSNGAIVLDLATREVIRMRTIETEVALRLVHALRERLPGIVFAVEWERLAHEPGFEADWPLPPDTPISDAVGLLEEPPAKLILQHTDHEVEILAAVAREIAGESAFVTSSGGGYVEISAAGVNKASALAEVCEERRIPPEEVVAFGDQPTDLPMLIWAGRGVAVANAHPDVAEAAGEVTASVDEDGVALVLERLTAT